MDRHPALTNEVVAKVLEEVEAGKPVMVALSEQPELRGHGITVGDFEVARKHYRSDPKLKL